MRRLAGTLATTVLIAALGCGGSEKTETVEFKATDVSQFEEMKNQMIKQYKEKSFQKQGYVPPPGKDAAKK